MSYAVVLDQLFFARVEILNTWNFDLVNDPLKNDLSKEEKSVVQKLKKLDDWIDSLPKKPTGMFSHLLKQIINFSVLSRLAN